jgi:hypothetical protein
VRRRSGVLDAVPRRRPRRVRAVRCCGRCGRRSATRGPALRKIICARQIPRDLGLRKQPGRSFGERSGSLTRGQHGHRPARPVARSAEFPTGRMAIIAQARCNQLRPAPQQLDAKRFVEILVQDVRRGGSGAPARSPRRREWERRLEPSNKDSKLRTKARSFEQEKGRSHHPPRRRLRHATTCPLPSDMW